MSYLTTPQEARILYEHKITTLEKELQETKDRLWDLISKIHKPYKHGDIEEKRPLYKEVIVDHHSATYATPLVAEFITQGDYEFQQSGGHFLQDPHWTQEYYRGQDFNHNSVYTIKDGKLLEYLEIKHEDSL